MTTYNFGDIVLVAFPYSGGVGRKQRPALVILDIKANNKSQQVPDTNISSY